MKMKTYLRGLGTGIVVSAILMALVSGSTAMSDEEIKARALQLGMVTADNTLVSKNTKASDEVTAVTEESKTAETEETQTSDTEEAQTTESKETQTPEAEESQPQEPKETKENQPPETKESQPQEPKETKENQPPETKESQPQEPKETQPPETKESQPQEPKESQPAETRESVPTQTGDTVTITVRSGYSSNTVAKLLADAGLVESATQYDTYLCANGYDKKICVGVFEIPVGTTDAEIARIITTRN